MKRFGFAAVGACLIQLAVSSGPALAQPPVPGGYSRPPAFSPYLNLARGGSAALNYYGLVRPELQFRQSLLNLSNNVAANQQAIGDVSAGLGATPLTGHPTQFMNLGGYFMNNGSMGAGGYGFGVRSAQANRNRFSASFAPGSMGGGGAGLGAPPAARR
jgi:hypothetical protein